MPMKKIEDRLPPINPQERHLPCIVLVDGSSSTLGKPNEELNKGLQLMGEALNEDEQAAGCCEVSIISFASDVKTEMGFRAASQYEAPHITANGCTAMNEAINTALDALEARKQEYKVNGITHYRPWLFVLTDGYPTDTALEASTRSRLQEYISRKKVNYIPMGIGDAADIEHLKSYYPDTVQNKVVLTASKENFKDAFVWLSDSMISTSKSDPNLGSISSTPLPQTISLGL